MRKISEMYRASGGTNGKHRCAECSNLIKQKQNKRIIFRCQIYSESYTDESSWRTNYPACAWFNQEWKRIRDERPPGDQIPGQMNIFDFIKTE